MNTQEVQKLANLARLDLQESDLAKLASEMDAIIGFVDEIQKVQIPEDAIRDLTRVNVFRDDVIAPIAPAHDLIEAAPMHQDHFVKVPKVIGE